MAFWDWFKSDGDHLFTFVSLASLGLAGVPGVSALITHYTLVAGVLATAAHNSFFPTKEIVK